MENEKYMKLALDQAKIAFDNGQFPVGCVIVHNKKVIAKGIRHGTSQDRPVFSEIDHAEIRALKDLETSGIQFNPEKSVLFSTMEPCLMCFGAIILSGIKKIVYSFEDPMGGGTGCDLKKLALLYQKSMIDIIPGVLREKSLDLFYNFFNKEDNLYWAGSSLEEYVLDQKNIKDFNK